MAAGVGVAALLPAPVPAEALENFSADFLDAARRYNRGAYLMFALSHGLIIWMAAWIALTARGRRAFEHFLSITPFTRCGRNVSGGRWRRWDREPAPWLGAGVAGGLLWLALAAVKLPLRFLRGFYWEHRFGLSHQSAGGWFADYGMQSTIEAVLAAAGVAVLYVLIDRWPRRWWLPAGTMLAVGLTALAALKPIIIEPMFHDFTPLEDHELRGRLEQMASRLDIAVHQVLVMDASPRTRRSNAYFTGIGPSRRIVLYDNLLDSHPGGEVELVVAHELAHWHESHVAKGIALGAAGSFAALFLLARLLDLMSEQHIGQGPWTGPAEKRKEHGSLGRDGPGARRKNQKDLLLWHPRDPAGAAVIILLVLCAGIISLPGQNAVSRRWEQTADRISYQISGQAHAARDLARRLTETNLSDVNRRGWLKLMLSTHPSPLERIEAAKKHTGSHR